LKTFRFYCSFEKQANLSNQTKKTTGENTPWYGNTKFLEKLILGQMNQETSVVIIEMRPPKKKIMSNC